MGFNKPLNSLAIMLTAQSSNNFSLNWGINHSVRKPLNKVSPKSSLDLAPHAWVLHDFSRSNLNRIQKRTPQPRFTVFIKGCCLTHLNQSLGVKD